MDKQGFLNHAAPSNQDAHVSRRRLVERAGLLGASLPTLGALFLSASARPTEAAPAERASAVRSSNSDTMDVFSREFRLNEIPDFPEGPVLFLVRRLIARDAPIEEAARPGVALYYVAALPEGGYLELIHSSASTGSIEVHSKTGDNRELPIGNTADLYEGDSALVVNATYGVECDAFEGGILFLAGLNNGDKCGGSPCP
jgi:hypothetical protein